MRRPLRSGDVIVADANVFNDFLSPLVDRRDPGPSLELLAAVSTCCARFGCTNPLLNQYRSSEPQARPLFPGSIQSIPGLRDKGKLFVKGVSAATCDAQDKHYLQLPKEDRFLLDVAAAVGAIFIVTTDLGIPLGERIVPLRKGGRLEVDIVTPAELLGRIAVRP